MTMPTARFVVGTADSVESGILG
jgi:hypothetical protein